MYVTSMALVFTVPLGNALGHRNQGIVKTTLPLAVGYNQGEGGGGIGRERGLQSTKMAF
jgi:hypothetical protein